MRVAKYISQYMKTADVRKPMKVTISTAEARTFKNDDGREQEKLVVFVEESEQGIVLGPTALQGLVDLMGTDESDSWAGKTVVLYNDPNVTFGKARVGGLRFRAEETK